MKNKESVRITLAKNSSIHPWLPLLTTVSAPVLKPRAQSRSLHHSALAPSSSLVWGQPRPGLWFWHLHQGQGKEPPPIPPLVHLSSKRKRFADPANSLTGAWDPGTARKMQFPFSQSLGHTPRTHVRRLVITRTPSRNSHRFNALEQGWRTCRSRQVRLTARSGGSQCGILHVYTHPTSTSSSSSVYSRGQDRMGKTEGMLRRHRSHRSMRLSHAYRKFQIKGLSHCNQGHPS